MVSDSEVSKGTGIGKHFLEIVDVLYLEGFVEGDGEVFFLELRVEYGGRKLESLGIQCFVCPFLIERSNTSWEEEEELGMGGFERVLLLAQSASS